MREKKKNSVRRLRPMSDKHQWRATEELSLLHGERERGKKSRRRRRRWSLLVIFFYPFLCLSLSKFQRMFTQFERRRARVHFVKSLLSIACLTTIRNVHCPRGTHTRGYLFSLLRLLAFYKKSNSHRAKSQLFFLIRTRSKLNNICTNNR